MDIVACSIGGFNVYGYGVVTALALIVGMLVTKVVTSWYNEQFSIAIDMFVISIPVSLIFARFFYVILHWNLYSANFSEIVYLNHGGISIYGAFVGFLLTVYLYTKNYYESFWHWVDIFMPAIALGLAIDQLGHFFFQFAVGIPAEGKMVEYIEYAFRPTGFQNYEYFKPVALYQAGWQFIIFFATIVLTMLHLKKNKVLSGSVFLVSILLLCLGRFAFGFFYLKADPGFHLHLGQILGLIGCVVSIGLLVARRFISNQPTINNIFKA